MKYIIFLSLLFTFQALFFSGCFNADSAVKPTTYDIPTRNHDLGYIPYDAKLDKPDFLVCDSTNIRSGRNRLQYPSGRNKFRKDITSKYLYKSDYKDFSGYIVVRFVVNCKGESGRYRAESLNLDFSPSDAPSDLLQYAITLVKSLDHWTKSTAYDIETEYSKFINLKISNGKIEHVVL